MIYLKKISLLFYNEIEIYFYVVGATVVVATVVVVAVVVVVVVVRKLQINGRYSAYGNSHAR